MSHLRSGADSLNDRPSSVFASPQGSRQDRKIFASRSRVMASNFDASPVRPRTVPPARPPPPGSRNRGSPPPLRFSVNGTHPILRASVSPPGLPPQNGGISADHVQDPPQKGTTDSGQFVTKQQFKEGLDSLSATLLGALNAFKPDPSQDVPVSSPQQGSSPTPDRGASRAEAITRLQQDGKLNVTPREMASIKELLGSTGTKVHARPHLSLLETPSLSSAREASLQSFMAKFQSDHEAQLAKRERAVKTSFTSFQQFYDKMALLGVWNPDHLYNGFFTTLLHQLIALQQTYIAAGWVMPEFYLTELWKLPLKTRVTIMLPLPKPPPAEAGEGADAPPSCDYMATIPFDLMRSIQTKATTVFHNLRPTGPPAIKPNLKKTASKADRALRVKIDAANAISNSQLYHDQVKFPGKNNNFSGSPVSDGAYSVFCSHHNSYYTKAHNPCILASDPKRGNSRRP